MKQYRKGLTAAVERCVLVYICARILPMVPLCSEKLYLLLFWSRLVHADLAMYATLAALGTYTALCPCEPLRPVGDTQAVSYGARSRQYSPLLPGSRPPARNLNLSPSDHAQGPCVGFIYIQQSKLFKNGPGMLKKRLRSLRSLGRASI